MRKNNMIKKKNPQKPKTIQEKDIKKDIKKNINITEIKNPLSLQLMLKINLEKECITEMKELPKSRIGLIGGKTLSIYSLNTFKLIQEITVEELKDWSQRIDGFIELKNSDIILWSEDIIFIYKLIDNKYKCHQKIGLYYHDGIYKINAFIELKNGNLICANTFGLNIFGKKKKTNDCYSLLSKKKMNTDIKKMIEMESNFVILLNNSFVRCLITENNHLKKMEPIIVLLYQFTILKKSNYMM